MAQSIHAVLTRALGFLEALLTPPRGRHSAAALRRRRSTRVRRYAPLPAPPAARVRRPASTTPPRAPLPADDVALVRGYYRAFEDERDRVQADAEARLHRWTSSAPVGDLLAPDPDDLADLRRVTRQWLAQQRRQAVAA